MSETDSTESSRSRWITRISIGLAAIAALVVLAFIGFGVTVYVVTERYESLHQAAKEGNTFAVRCFLLRGADVNAKANGGMTPMHSAVLYRHTRIVKLLIAKGADVNAKEISGSTPLHVAAYSGEREIAKLLIANGADVDAKMGDVDCTTPLAVAMEEGHEDVAALLRKHGAKK